MKRPQKHYRSAEEIIRLIDATRERLAMVPVQMAAANSMADEFRDWLNRHPLDGLNDQAKAVYHRTYQWMTNFREEAEMLERSIPRLQRKADLLKQKLSAFQTMPMKGIVGEDESVV